MSAPQRQIVLISGLSGSGKSVALRALEDSGFFCMDNCPLSFVPAIVEGLLKRGEANVALTLDARSGEGIKELPHTLHSLAQKNFKTRLLFLDANDQELIRRFSETRRPHPLADGIRSVRECIALERELLEDAAEQADRIDTTNLAPNALRDRVRNFVELDSARMTLFFESFGFKHGIPLDADFVFDVRCIPNPFYDPELRPLTGQDPAIGAFLKDLPQTIRMEQDILRFLQGWIPDFIRDNRLTLTVGIGCTGGQHRSVYLAQRLADKLKDQYPVRVIHRELGT
jgi:UPF0042 nucleotide-binding protein